MRSNTRWKRRTDVERMNRKRESAYRKIRTQLAIRNLNFAMFADATLDHWLASPAERLALEAAMTSAITFFVPGGAIAQQDCQW